MNAITRNIPNAITCINVLSGCLAIVFAAHTTDLMWGLPAYRWAFIFIAVGAVADFFDGFAARALGAYSELGKELDSLCDLVTFGVAPAMIIFNILQRYGVDPLAAWAALLIPVAGAIRLARFNIDTRQSTTFIGLPIPANAIFWIGYTAAFMEAQLSLSYCYIFIPVVLAESLLMNSNIKMFSLKTKGFSLSRHYPQILLVVAAILFCAFLGVAGLMWFILFYILLSMALCR